MRSSAPTTAARHRRATCGGPCAATAAGARPRVSRSWAWSLLHLGGCCSSGSLCDGSHVEPPQHALSHGRPRRVQSEAARVAVATCPNAVAGVAVTTLQPSWEPRSESVRKRPGWRRSPPRRRPRSVTRPGGTAIRIAVAAVVVLAVPVRREPADGRRSTRRHRDVAAERRRRRPTLGPTDDDHARVHEPRPRRARCSPASRPRRSRRRPTRRPPRSSRPPSSRARARARSAGDIVTVHYAGVLSDGTEFDESWSTGPALPRPDRRRPGHPRLGPGARRREDRRAPPPRDRRPTTPTALRGRARSRPTRRWRSTSTSIDIQPAAG